MNTDNPPLTILFLNDYLHGMGGAERNLIQLLNGMDKSIFRPIVCCLSGGRLASELKEKGHEIYNLNLKRVYDLHGIRALIWLFQLIKKRRIRLLVTYHEGSDFLGLMAAGLSGIPIISSRRDMGYKLNKRHIAAYRLCGNHFDAIIAVSKAVKKMIVAREKTAPDKIVTINNGVDVDLFSGNYNRTGIRSGLGLNNHENVIGMIGSLRKIKGHKYLIEAASKVIRHIPETKFLIVGRDYNEPECSEKVLTTIARKLGVTNHLIFTGERSDVPELLSAVDIIVNPSLSEGMSNTILEAMAAGKTVIASDVGGNREVINDHENGFLFPSKDTQTLANIIVNCLKNPKERALIGKRAQEVAGERYSLQLMCEQNMALYAKCIGYEDL